MNKARKSVGDKGKCAQDITPCLDLSWNLNTYMHRWRRSTSLEHSVVTLGALGGILGAGRLSRDHESRHHRQEQEPGHG